MQVFLIWIHKGDGRLCRDQKHRLSFLCSGFLQQVVRVKHSWDCREWNDRNKSGRMRERRAERRESKLQGAKGKEGQTDFPLEAAQYSQSSTKQIQWCCPGFVHHFWALLVYYSSSSRSHSPCWFEPPSGQGCTVISQTWEGLLQFYPFSVWCINEKI